MISRVRKPKAPVIPSIETVHLPAPVGGLATLEAASAMPANKAILLYNMLPSEYGLRARLGSRQWCTGLTGAGDTYVRSIIPFTGSNDSGTGNKLFAATSSGIWDVTESGGVTSAWAGVTDYALGDFVTQNGLSFVCVDDGTSHGSNGLPSLWAPLTAFVIGSRAINGDNVYACLTTGITGSGDGPTGTGTSIVDGGCAWDYVGSKDSISDGFARWRYAANNTPPTLVYPFADTSNRAGHGISHVQVTAGGHFLLYWDEVNGLHVYTESTGLWTAPTQGVGATQIDGVNPADLVAGTVWKGFIVHIERNSGRAWFSDAGAIYGTASPLNTAFKLKAGGNLVCAATWTYDAGAGVDDALVFVSRGGDVLIYQGTDPSSASTFGLQGAWQVGTMPAGRELMTDLGGELLLITRTGILPISKLVVGAATQSTQYQTADIGPLFNEAMLAKATIPGWTMRLHPEENALMVTVPQQEGQPTTQLVMSMTTKGWARYRDLDIYSSNVFDGKMYFGTVDGSICINDGYVDGRTLAAPDEYEPVTYSMIGAFQGLGNGRQKQVQLIRPDFMSRSPPAFDVGARFDFDISELETVTDATSTMSAWDSGLWDSAVWGGDYTPSSEVRGAAGMGVHVAITLRGESSDRTILVGFDVGFTQGGFL